MVRFMVRFVEQLRRCEDTDDAQQNQIQSNHDVRVVQRVANFVSM
jgi:hypothetical protein